MANTDQFIRKYLPDMLGFGGPAAAFVARLAELAGGDMSRPASLAIPLGCMMLGLAGLASSHIATEANPNGWLSQTAGISNQEQ